MLMIFGALIFFLAKDVLMFNKMFEKSMSLYTQLHTKQTLKCRNTHPYNTIRVRVRVFKCTIQ